MATKITLASLVSHMPVEIGDTIRPPEVDHPGIIHSYDGDYVKITWPLDRPEGRLVISKHSAGLVYMYAEHLRVRPCEGPIDHARHSIWNAMVAAESGPPEAPKEQD